MDCGTTLKPFRFIAILPATVEAVPSTIVALIGELAGTKRSPGTGVGEASIQGGVMSGVPKTLAAPKPVTRATRVPLGTLYHSRKPVPRPEKSSKRKR